MTRQLLVASLLLPFLALPVSLLSGWAIKKIWNEIDVARGVILAGGAVTLIHFAVLFIEVLLPGPFPGTKADFRVLNTLLIGVFSIVLMLRPIAVWSLVSKRMVSQEETLKLKKGIKIVRWSLVALGINYAFVTLILSSSLS